jgi:phosphatidylglycerophosphatase GEP4
MSNSAFLQTLKVLKSPSLCQPHLTFSSFNELLIPPSIKAIVLDKDNTFAAPKDKRVWSGYEVGTSMILENLPNLELMERRNGLS